MVLSLGYAEGYKHFSKDQNQMKVEQYPTYSGMVERQERNYQ
ncbi:hypothetical protein [Phocaeicola sartorii]